MPSEGSRGLPAISTMREQPLRLAMHLVTQLGGISEDEVLQLELCDFVSLAEEALFLVEHHDNAHTGIPA